MSSRICSSQTRTARGVKPRLTIRPRSSLWRGGSMSIIDLRASISSGSRSCSDVPPISEEKVSPVAVDGADVVVARDAQNPGPSGSSLQVHGVLAAQEREHLVRDAVDEGVVIGEVDVLERRRRRCSWSPRLEVVEVLVELPIGHLSRGGARARSA